MKTEIVGELTQENEIDWSKPMIVNDDENLIECLLLTNGKHNSVEETFEAMVIVKGFYCAGHFSKCWKKDYFKPINHPITIKFSND